MRALLALITITLTVQATLAKPATTPPEVGTGYPLFTFEKNENPENIMVVYTKLDDTCRVQREGSTPVFDMYWLMNRSKFKPTHPTIKSQVRKRLQVIPVNESNGFYIQVNDLKEVKSDLKDPRLTIVAERQSSRCQVLSFIELGPSDGNITMKLDSIYSEVKKTKLPPFRKLLSVTLNGVNAETGKKVSRKYLAK